MQYYPNSLKCVAVVMLVIQWSCPAKESSKASALPSPEENVRLYDKVVGGIHICRGCWRPMFESEHVVWISPPWESKEYIYIDFPEAIFTGETLFYLGHIDSRFPARYNYKLPEAAWEETDSGVRYERKLDDEVSLGGEAKLKGKDTIALKIWIENNSDEPLKDIKLQTCSFLYPIKEFSQMTNANKLIHHADLGWITLEYAQKNLHNIPENGRFLVGWREGPAIADLPIIITQSEDKSHYVTMTWFENTYSFIGNENHPCFHADPFFQDIASGKTGQIKGEMVFFEGSLDDFVKELKSIYPEMDKAGFDTIMKAN